MWDEDKDLVTGETYWSVEYHEIGGTFGASGFVGQLGAGRFEACVEICTDGATYHAIKKAEFETLKDAQRWCDTVWNAPENLPVRIQMCQMDILHSIDKTLYEILDLVKKRW